MKEPLISVIIPTYNRAKMLCDCVASVLATDYPALEVIVVDDCSPDDTKGELARRFGGDSRVRYQRNVTNSQSAITRNNGARNAKGEYLFFLDDDNILHHDIFTEMIACFRRHPDAGLVAPLTIHQGSPSHNVWTVGADFNHWNCRTNDAVNGNIPLAKVMDMPSDDFPTTYSPNAFLVKREVHEKVGGFDEVMQMQFDESDYGWRIMEAGYSEFIVRKAATDHYGYLAPDQVPALRAVGMERANRTYCFARNRAIFARRHFNFIQALSVAFIWMPIFAVYYCRLALVNRRPDIAWAFFKGTLAGMFGLYSHRKPDYAGVQEVPYKFLSRQWMIDFIMNRRHEPPGDSNGKDIKVFVVQHKQTRLPEVFDNRSIYVPIQAGRAVNRPIDGILGDDTPPTCSKDNVYINEMSAIYWIGKHYKELGNPEYIGFEHYRRFLDWTPSKLRPNVVIANPIFTIASNKVFVSSFLIEPWFTKYMEMFRKEFVDDGYDDIERFWKKHWFYSCNCFIMHRDVFERYFAFTERCLSVCRKIYSSDKEELAKLSPLLQRQFGYAMERMTGYWIWHERNKGIIRVHNARLRFYDIPNLENSSR